MLVLADLVAFEVALADALAVLVTLEAAKVEFSVRNAGEGGSCGDSYHNQIWCVRNMLGDDIDLAHSYLFQCSSSVAVFSL